MKNICQVFFSNSPRMERIKVVVDEIAKTDVTVLIKGESGTGKEIVAEAIHQNSYRSGKPFLKVNCAAIPGELLESELFGFEKGAFTGAHLTKPGKFELANGGTILLNEIGEIGTALQAKLLQVLQSGEFSRLGGNADVRADTRIIVTTKDHLEKCMIEGGLRKDLLFRINVINILVPPLRERKEQIPYLSQFFFNLYSAKYAKYNTSLSDKILAIFKEYDWPGNLRELENVIKRIILFGEKEEIHDYLGNPINGEMNFPPSEIPRPDGLKGRKSLNLKRLGKEAAEQAEKLAIQKTLQQTYYNRKKTAELLAVSYKALLYKMEKYRMGDLKKFRKFKEGSG
jgi:two-component system response regulator AtoC